MSSVLIILFFWGIAALIKRHATTSKSNADTAGAPTNQGREEIERRIREIFGLPTESMTQTVTTTTAKPMESRVEVPQPRLATHPAESITPANTQSNRSRVMTRNTSPQGNNGSFKTKQAQTSAKTDKTNKAVEPTSSPAKSEIGGIMEDFSLERAVIYSEILEPKFKEY